MLLAFGRKFTEENLSLGIASKLDCAGALLFIAIALTGLFYGAASFFYNFLQQDVEAGHETALRLVSAGTIPLSNIAIGIKVGASLFLVIVVLSSFRPKTQGKNEEKN
jgi:multicomponent Na+:H+ antiporter subunit B